MNESVGCQSAADMKRLRVSSLIATCDFFSTHDSVGTRIMPHPDDHPVPMDESPVKQSMFSCTFDTCGRAFKTKKYLKRHEQLHTQQV